jgi:hypothetical protein
MMGGIRMDNSLVGAWRVAAWRRIAADGSMER